ncbi:hypothetical protein FRC06_004810 [Ceratobasidium sp. 370]|nr:hypothetical protein FRC06_004810 [Ceratobasidium sp. 370]
MTQAHAMINLQSAERGENDPKNRMKRAVFLAGRLRDGEALLSDEENLPEASTENSKILETQHWLELTDGSTIENGKKKTPKRISSCGSTVVVAKIFPSRNAPENSWKRNA